MEGRLGHAGETLSGVSGVGLYSARTGSHPCSLWTEVPSGSDSNGGLLSTGRKRPPAAPVVPAAAPAHLVLCHTALQAARARPSRRSARCPAPGPASSPAVPALGADKGGASAVGAECLTLDGIPGTKMGAREVSVGAVSPWECCQVPGEGVTGVK